MNRLFGIVYCLLEKRKVTARELADHFEVSVRTIYRDLDRLSASGVPVYTDRGKGGGVRLLENFVLSKSLLNEQEQNDVLMSLQSLSALNVPDAERVLHKLSVQFNKQSVNWLEVDFSHWGSGKTAREQFTELKAALLSRQMVVFDYFGSRNAKTRRKVEPLKIVFKGQSWYLYGYCHLKNDFRIFKITRIKHLKALADHFERKIPEKIWDHLDWAEVQKVTLKIKFDQSVAFRVFDEFDPDCIREDKDGYFTVETTYPENEWVYSYLLSFGSHAEVMEPSYVRARMKKKFAEGLALY